MPTPMDALLGLVVASIGLLILVVAFSIADSKKKMISYSIAAVLTVLGCYYYVSSEVRGMMMRRRIANIQKQQQVNMEEIQKRLQEQAAQSQNRSANTAPVAPPKR